MKVIEILRGRLQDIDGEVFCLSEEQAEIETTIRVLQRLTPELFAPHTNSPETATESTAARMDGLGLKVTGPKARPDLTRPLVSEDFAPAGDHAEPGAGTQALHVETPPEQQPVSAAPGDRKLTRADRIREVLALHPDWTARQIGDEIGLDQKHVRKVANQAGILLKSGKIASEPRPPRPVRPETVKSRIIACHDEHPDWPAAVVAKHLNVPRSSVTGYGSVLGIKFARNAAFLSNNNDRRALAEMAIPALESPQEAQKPVLAPTPAEIPPLPPAPLQTEDDGAESRRRKYGEVEVGDPDEDYVHPSVVKFSPGAKWFRLRRADGMWLAMGGQGFVKDKNNGWIGRIGQLRAVRDKFSDAKGLQIVGVAAVAK